MNQGMAILTNKMLLVTGMLLVVVWVDSRLREVLNCTVMSSIISLTQQMVTDGSCGSQACKCNVARSSSVSNY